MHCINHFLNRQLKFISDRYTIRVYKYDNIKVESNSNTIDLKNKMK